MIGRFGSMVYRGGSLIERRSSVVGEVDLG